jgi:hypothetical protein
MLWSGLRESLCLVVETVQELLVELGTSTSPTSLLLPLDMEPELVMDRTRDICSLLRSSFR